VLEPSSNFELSILRVKNAIALPAQHFLQSGFGRDAYSLSENRGGEMAIADGRKTVP
jgi:hypothetical protein